MCIVSENISSEISVAELRIGIFFLMNTFYIASVFENVCEVRIKGVLSLVYISPAWNQIEAAVHLVWNINSKINTNICSSYEA